MFETDAKSIDISLEAEKCGDRSVFCIDIIKNDKIIGSVKNFEEEKMNGCYS